MSRWIRFFRKTRWSHTGIIWLDGQLTFEAVAGGSQVRSWRDHYEKNEAQSFKVFRAKDKSVQVALNAALGPVMARLAGKRYGWLQLPGFVLAWLAERLGLQGSRSLPLGRDGEDSAICTELVTYLLVEAARGSKPLAEWLRPRLRLKDQESLGPDDLERWLTDSGLFEVQFYREVTQ
jgi:hypothetical protein